MSENNTQYGAFDHLLMLLEKEGRENIRFRFNLDLIQFYCHCAEYMYITNKMQIASNQKCISGLLTINTYKVLHKQKNRGNKVMVYIVMYSIK